MAKSVMKSGGVASYLKTNYKKAKIISGREEFYKFNEVKNWIKTGLRPLDIAIGGKGIPTGRVILISADASLGKTLLGLHLARAFQRHHPAGIVHFIETEGTVSPEWVEQLGVDVSENALVQPDIHSLEHLFGYIEMAGLWHMKHEPNRPVLFYVDSLSMCPPGKTLEQAYGETIKQPGTKAKIISEKLEKLETTLRRSNNTLLFISQLRSKIAINPMQPILGDQQSVVGGNALNFYNSLHLRLRQVFGSEIYSYKDAKKRDRVYEQEGMEVEVYVYKSKISFPHRKAFLPLYWRESPAHPAGFDPEEADLNWLADRLLVDSYDGVDKALRKAGANTITLAGKTHHFVGLSGWKKLIVQPGIYDAVGDLMIENMHSRCAKDDATERTGHQKSHDADDAEMDRASAQMARDIENLEDEAPEFDDPTPKKGKGKGKAKKGKDNPRSGFPQDDGEEDE